MVRRALRAGVGAKTRPDPRERWALGLEVIIVSFVTWAWTIPTTIWTRFAPPASGHPIAAAVTAYRLGFALRDAAFAALILYLIWRSAGSLEPAGLVRLRWWKELPTAGAVLVASAIVALMAGLLAHAAHLPTWATDVIGETTDRLIPIYLFISALAEELIFRAYLITRLEPCTLACATPPGPSMGRGVCNLAQIAEARAGALGLEPVRGVQPTPLRRWARA